MLRLLLLLLSAIPPEASGQPEQPAVAVQAAAQDEPIHQFIPINGGFLAVYWGQAKDEPEASWHYSRFMYEAVKIPKKGDCPEVELYLPSRELPNAPPILFPKYAAEAKERMQKRAAAVAQPQVAAPQQQQPNVVQPAAVQPTPPHWDATKNAFVDDKGNVFEIKK